MQATNVNQPHLNRDKLSLLILIQLLTLSIFSYTVVGQSPPADEKLEPRTLHGGIEISPRVVRAIGLRISNGEEGLNIKILFSNTSTIPTPYPSDGNLKKEYIHDVARIVQSDMEMMQKEYQIPLAQVYVIGNSDLVTQNPNDLKNEVFGRTGKTINFLNAEAEIQLEIAGVIPRRYQLDNKLYDNRGISSLIDIGITVTKGGYQQLKQTDTGRPGYDFSTWDVAKGVITFADEVGKAAGENADNKTFARMAASMSNSFREALRTEALKRPGILTRKKLYLTGGIIMALVDYLHPDDQRPYIPITLADINAFHDRAVSDPESLLNTVFPRIHDVKLRAELSMNRDAVKNTFNAKTLIAGAELLRAMAAELNLWDKKVLYPRHSQLARILSYVRLQPEQ
ncbi:MAG: hypothetical protein J2P41_04775 [Blastocatellia bacterium]|nr:hypothetical protein [Blastocatellia bacterium]